MVRITNLRPASESDPHRRRGVDRRTLLKGAAGAAMTGAAMGAATGASAQSTPAASPTDETFFPSGVEGVPDAYLAPPEPFTPSYDVNG
ncbi:MAG TPA: hypothetical protein VHG52_05075, partial [Thermomicrobiales bacterium]|nr:hypothetical protein [Thermomicrobiales bacterium]